MITPQQIPAEVVEAAARAIHAREYDEAHYPFDREDAVQQSLLRSQARAAIAAALNAWPMARMEHPLVDWTGNLILPLTQEASSD